MSTVAYSNVKPEAVSYMPLPGGGADVWLRRNITEVSDDAGGTIWQAEEVHFYTTLMQSEVAANFDTLFESAEISETITDATITNAKADKKSELDAANSETITKGFDLTLSDGNTYTFGMDSNSQSDLTGLMLQVLAGATECDYYTADGSCLTLSNSDMVLLSNYALAFRSYCSAYYHCLCDWVDALTSLAEINAIQYGDVVPETYRSAYLIKYATALGVSDYAAAE